MKILRKIFSLILGIIVGGLVSFFIERLGHENLSIYQDVPDFNPNETKRVKNEFKGEVILYEEPQFLPDTLTSFPLDGKDILDYSGNLENLRMSDYKMAFSPPEETEDVEERDYPKENIEYH